MPPSPLPPDTTPATSTLPVAPAMTPAPAQRRRPEGTDTGNDDDGLDDDVGFTLPKLRLEIRDLAHPGARGFLAAVHATNCATTALRRLLRLLYASPSSKTTTPPPTRSVTLVLRDMPGVAYTTASDLDRDHKEIHLSLGYVARVDPPARRPAEVAGVLTHELVHCLQHNGLGSCPGGLVEGVADWVRLRCRLAPPHWRRDPDQPWDAGYQHTAYFLDYLERRFGDGTVRRLNEKLRVQRYEEKTFWTELLGRPVAQLWGDYVEKLRDEETVVVNKEDVSGEEAMAASTAGQS